MKNMWICFFFLVAPNIAMAQGNAAKVTVARWPADRRAAISLTFDDGIDSHLDNAGPILKKHHLNGTFFVNPGRDPWKKRKMEWKQLAQEGNELGNHTVNHPCLLAQITPHSQDYTPEMMDAEIRDAAQDITALVNSQRGLTFAYPCGNMSFGKPAEELNNAALYMRYVSQHAFGARSDGAGGPEDPDQLNVLNIGTLGDTEGKGFVSLLEMAEPAIHGKNWGIYCFHGVGGDWLAITSEALDELAGYFERHPEIWTAPFGDVLRYTQERRAASIQIRQSSDTSLDLALQWPMDSRVYDLPLTLKIEVPNIWTGVIGTGDTKALNAKVVGEKDGTVILVNVPPQTKAVRIVAQ